MLRQDSSNRKKCQNFFYTASKYVGYTVCFASTYPNIQYSVAFPFINPADVGFEWVKTQYDNAPGYLALSVLTGLSTLTISGSFTVQYYQIAGKKIKEEFSLLIQTGTNKKRFAASVLMALIAAITGGSVSGAPYSGATKILPLLLGFAFTGATSFVGLTNLIIEFSDKDVAFQKALLSYLKQLKPTYRNQVNELLRNKVLNTETLAEFLKNFFDLQLRIEAENPNDSIFIPQTITDQRKQLAGKIFDVLVAGTISTIASLVYIQAGYAGTNIITNSALNNWNQAGQIAIGTFTGFSPIMFIFLGMKCLRELIIDLYPDIKNSHKKMAYAFGLFLLCTLNSTWFYSLGRMTVVDDNIFSLSASAGFGAALPIAGLLTSLILGITGLAPRVFPPEINVETPQIDDAAKMLASKHHQPVVDALKTHSFFSRAKNAKPTVQLEEIKTQSDHDIEMQNQALAPVI